MNFYISAATDIGPVKKTNQDSYCVRSYRTSQGPMAFAILCDGMGGLGKCAEANDIELNREGKSFTSDTLLSLREEYADAEMMARELVAYPGTSEHQLGLALDLVDARHVKLDSSQENTKAYKWLYEHCAEYGFIVRYPNGKTDITGIIYEPWHFRYVGVEAATYMVEHNLCLEEFVALYQ